MRAGNEIALIMNEVIGGASRLAHRLVYPCIYTQDRDYTDRIVTLQDGGVVIRLRAKEEPKKNQRRTKEELKICMKKEWSLYEKRMKFA